MRLKEEPMKMKLLAIVGIAGLTLVGGPALANRHNGTSLPTNRPDYLQPDGKVDLHKAVAENDGWTRVWLPGGNVAWARSEDVWADDGRLVPVYITKDAHRAPIGVNP
jgi:hypothetical protein